MDIDVELGLSKATFAAGKFWGVQFYFDQIPGVIMSKVGYMGGTVENPTAEMVVTQNTGHAEVVQVMYDPDLINYDTLLKHFFKIQDPTQEGGQGKDLGIQFRSVIFYHTDDQKVLAEIILNEMVSHYKKPIQTQILPATTFYLADEKDQKYTQKTGIGMSHVPYEHI